MEAQSFLSCLAEYQTLLPEAVLVFEIGHCSSATLTLKQPKTQSSKLKKKKIPAHYLSSIVQYFFISTYKYLLSLSLLWEDQSWGNALL